jgi:hypothetical protein
MEQLESKSGSPIAIFFACYTAAFDFNQRGDCLAEEMLIQQKGPVAVLGASRVSMPYAMAVLSNEMLKEYFGRKHQTLGEMIAGAKRASLATQNEAEDKNRVLLDTLAATLSPTRELLDKERLENLALFNLIGDPLLRLNYPQELQLETEPVVESGSKIQIQGEAPSDGKLVLEISYRRDRTLKPYDKRKEYRGDVQQLDEFRQTYAEANLRQVATEAFTVKKGPFEVELEVPVWAIGAAYVRGFVESPEGFALGGHEIRIRRPSSTSP